MAARPSTQKRSPYEASERTRLITHPVPDAHGTPEGSHPCWLLRVCQTSAVGGRLGPPTPTDGEVLPDQGAAVTRTTLSNTLGERHCESVNLTDHPYG